MTTTKPEEIILYGHPLLNKSENHNILAATNILLRLKDLQSDFASPPPLQRRSFFFFNL